MHLRTRVLIAVSALILSACGDGGLLTEDLSSTSSALIVDYDGTFTLSWNVNPGPNQGGYTHLQQRFDGGAWMTIYGAGLGPQSHTVTVTQYGIYDYKVNYGWMPQNPCGGRYCFNPGLSYGSLTLQSVEYRESGGQGGSAGASGAGGSGGSAGQGGMSGGTAGTGGTPCTSDADCPAIELCASGACVPRGCGNGIPESGEECDDGNSIPGDGCEPDCTR